MLGELLGPMLAALVGTLTRHTHLAAKYNQPVNWVRVILDTPSVLLMAIIGGALGQYGSSHYQTPELFTWGLAGAFGYVGPTIVDTLIDFARTKAGIKKDDKPDGD